jgi:hypothetical protein
MIIKYNLVVAARTALLMALVGLGLCAKPAMAEPYLAVQQGYKCVQCHINPTGGGLRNTFGLIFAENTLPMQTLPQGAPTWLGQVVQDVIRVGGDLRTQYFVETTPHAKTQDGFQLEQIRLYADVSLIPNWLGVYVDEQVAPGGSQNMEAYARIGNTSDWYIKGGQFYLPFGWRLQDQSAFVRGATDINMYTPDTGVEFGLERSKWSAQLDITNGAINAGKPSGYQVLTNVVRVESSWRVGAAAAFTQSSAGDRDMFGLFAGVRTGPIAWLSEVDLVRQKIVNGSTLTMIPALVEADWAFHKGNNLKLTYEYYDPERRTPDNGQQRWSLVYELTPFPFLQFRTGVRRYEGPTQINTENQTLAFAELHAFL